jgi:hypothetical protein
MLVECSFPTQIVVLLFWMIAGIEGFVCPNRKVDHRALLNAAWYNEDNGSIYTIGKVAFSRASQQYG